MKKYILVFMIMMLVSGILSGCGVEHAGEVENGGTSGGAVSASAVSGQAVSAVEEKEKHLYSNDTNVYYIEYEEKDDVLTTLVERNLDTGAEKRMKIGDKDKDVAELLYVDNDWIYYYTLEEEEAVFYRAPMEIEGDSLHVSLEKEQQLFAEKEGVSRRDKYSHGPFCNGRWIAYATASRKFCRYDVSRREALSPIGEPAVMYARECTQGVIVGLTRGEDWEIDWLDGNSGKLIRIPIEEETYYPGMFPVGGWGVFLLDSHSEEEDGTEQKMNLLLWHTPDSAHPEGWTEVITEGEDIRSLLEDRGNMDEKAHFDPVSIFVRNNMIYLQISAEWERGDVIYRDMVILSRELNGDSKFKVETELSRILENPKENQKKFVKEWDESALRTFAFFFSRGLCMEMTEQYAFFVLSEKEEWVTALYEFESGKLRIIDDKAPEWGLLHRDSPLFITGAEYYMPDNGGRQFKLEE